jgi:hypothetical protein
MANDIGWGKAFDPETGWGMAAVTGAEIGYGNVVINSHSGETNISSQDRDNEPTEDMVILADGPLIYVDVIDKTSMMFLSFILAEGVEPMDMVAELYYNGRIMSGMPVFSGINDLIVSPKSGEYYVNLILVIDGIDYNFRSNILTV